MGATGTYLKKAYQHSIISGYAGGISLTYWLKDQRIFQDNWVLRGTLSLASLSSEEASEPRSIVAEGHGSWTMFLFGYSWHWRNGLSIESLMGVQQLSLKAEGEGRSSTSFDSFSVVRPKFAINVGWGV